MAIRGPQSGGFTVGLGGLAQQAAGQVGRGAPAEDGGSNWSSGIGIDRFKRGNPFFAVWSDASRAASLARIDPEGKYEWSADKTRIVERTAPAPAAPAQPAFSAPAAPPAQQPNPLTPSRPNAPPPAPVAPNAPNARLPQDPVQAERGNKRADRTLIDALDNPNQSRTQQASSVLSAVYRLPGDQMRAAQTLQRFNGPRGQRTVLGA